MRGIGVRSISLLFLLISGAAAQSGGVPRYDVYETALTSAASYSNPYTGVSVGVAFRAPSGRVLNAFAFHDGGSTWRVRVSPDETGTWTWTSSASDTSNSGLHNRSGSFSCVSSSNKGFIRPDASRKYYLSFSDGTPFYPVGDTAYGMVNGLTDAQRQNYLNTRAAQKVNFIRFFSTGTIYGPAAGLPAAEYWPWGGSPSSPDYDRFNPQFFHRLESILGELKSKGLYAEIEVFNYYKDMINLTAYSTAARRDQWARHVVSRLAAYSTVLMWTVSNEFEVFPDGIYRYDGATDDDFARAMGTLFHQCDPQKHPTTTHPWEDSNPNGLPSPGTRFGPGSELDVISQQHYGNQSDGSASGIEGGITLDRKYNKPVLNTESGYEGSHSADYCRHAAWRVFAAGAGGYAAGFEGTWRGSGDSVFSLSDNGFGGQIAPYATFITTKTDFRSLSPAQSLVNSPNLCLANSGFEYVVYAPTGGTVTLNLASGTYAVEWLNPRSGGYQGQTTVSGGASRSFFAPDGNDWVLHLSVTSGPPTGQPDVVLTSLSYADGVFSCTVKNQGMALTPAGVMVGVGYFVDDVWRSWGATAGPLAAGASETVGTSGSAYVIPDGTHTIRAYVDDVNRFAESNESNNQLSQTVTIGGTSPCDVVVTAFSYNNGVFTCTVRNQGGTATPAGVTIGVGYSVDGTWRTYGSVGGPLAAGTSVVIGTTGGSTVIPDGTHTITAFVDDVNRFAESNENNNQFSQTVTIGTTVPPSALMGRWKMDEGGGATAGDSSGNGNTGTLLNGTAWSSGHQGGALSFDGADDRVTIPDSSSLDLGAQGTLSAWLFPRAYPDGYATVLEKYAGGGQGAGYQLLLGSSNTASLWLMSGGSSSSLGSDPNLYAFNTWTHIVVTWDGSSVRFYKNGQLFGAAQAQPRNAGANSLPLVLGLDTGYTGRLNGLLDDVQVYNRALTASEIQTLTAGGATQKSLQPLITINGQGDFATVQDALGAAQPGEVVIVGSTTLTVPGGLTIPAGVSLRGAGPDETIFDADGAPVVLQVLGNPADGPVVLEELTVMDGTVGIDAGSAEVQLLNVRDETAAPAGAPASGGGSGGGSCGLTGMEGVLIVAILGFIRRRSRHQGVESGVRD